MKKKKVTERNRLLLRVFEKRGFYIALFSLMVLVGFSVMARRMQKNIADADSTFDAEAWRQAVAESKIETPDAISDGADDNTDDNFAASEPHGISYADVAAENTAPEAIAVSADFDEVEAFSLKMPCVGKISAECSLDDLVYCKATDDWRTHNGLDISAAEGDSVKAAAEGVVSQVYEDELLGVTVVIDHQNGYKTLYANLQSSGFINAGTEVGVGDIIGGVGKAGALENDAEPHLHFELFHDDEYLNPSEYLK